MHEYLCSIGVRSCSTPTLPTYSIRAPFCRSVSPIMRTCAFGLLCSMNGDSGLGGRLSVGARLLCPKVYIRVCVWYSI